VGLRGKLGRLLTWMLLYGAVFGVVLYGIDVFSGQRNSLLYYLVMGLCFGLVMALAGMLAKPIKDDAQKGFPESLDDIGQEEEE